MKGFDFGLVEALLVLVDEEHVSRAAARMAVSQSAMSYSLSRLRDLLGDEVLTRTSDGMVATPRAKALAASIAEPVSVLRNELGRPKRFQPSEASQTFRIAASGHAATVLVPKLLRKLLEKSPRSGLQILSNSFVRTQEQLQQAKVDIAIGYWPELAENVMSRSLFDEKLCIVSGCAHDFPEELSPTDLGNIGFACYSTLEGRLVNYETALEAALEEHGVSRRAVFTSPNMQTFPQLLNQAPLLAAVPERAVAVFKRTLKMKVHKVPVALPKFPVKAIWHRRSNEDGAHKWFRSELYAVATSLRANE